MVRKEWTKTGPENVPVFQGKRENERFLEAAWPKQTKWVSQRRENILELIDASSPCICYYFHCQRRFGRQSHRLATTIRAAIMLISIVQGSVLFPSRRGGARRRAVYLSGDSCRERSEPHCCASSITFTGGGADRGGIVCVSAPALSVTGPGD